MNTPPPLTLGAAARAMQAEYGGPDATFEQVSTDTRSIASGEVFFALRGERFDGAQFVAEALTTGALAAVVARDSLDRLVQVPRERLVIVDDPRLALGQLGAYWRSHYTHPLLALTGSSGKTTVKEMTAAILAIAAGGRDRVLATLGNLNNDIGVPLTLLRLRPDHLYAIVEMGMNHAGEIRYLSTLARPDVALVNNAGTAHLENLGSREAIARAKGEIFAGLQPDGAAVINGDDHYAPLWRKTAEAHRQISFALDRTADVRGRCALRADGCTLDIETPAGRGTVELTVSGEHNARNALAATAAAVALGVGVDAIVTGLAGYRGVKGRLQPIVGVAGAHLIDDTYNANPDSVAAAISVLAAASGLRVLVLGDMGELGPGAAALHAEVGDFAKAAGIDVLFALGTLSAHAVAAFGPNARHFSSVEELVDALRGELGPNVTVLVKGSRFMRMERVVAALAASPAVNESAEH
jgi:UDP-N-acetylmuramoyl-tripeptide--D-alanyl-D-alanine ligase